VAGPGRARVRLLFGSVVRNGTAERTVTAEGSEPIPPQMLWVLCDYVRIGSTLRLGPTRKGPTRK
jgi:hypothetical protein